MVESAVVYRIHVVRDMFEWKAILIVLMKFDVTYQTRDFLICRPTLNISRRILLSEKCVVRRFRRCAIVIECTYTNLDCIAYYPRSIYIYSLFLLCYKPVQHVTVLITLGNCNNGKYYNVIL